MSNKSYRDSGRNDKGMKKHGTKGKTDQAHKCSHRVIKGIKRNTGGRPVTKNNGDDLARKVNSSANLRLKSVKGNRTLDERRDKRIVQAYVQKTAIKEKTTAKRAVQSYKGAKSVGVNDVAKRLGAMTFNDGKRGRPKTIKALAKTKF